MFNPLDFLDFVKDLTISNHEEAKVRTIISRAYYAAFLVMREWLKTKGYKFPKGRKESLNHENVQNFLFLETQQRGPKDRLHMLRQLRNDADYDLNKQLSSTHVQKAITLAENVIRYTTL